ncbi:MAG: glycoside hydrolase family 19 protein [Myxococcaceae bacterium]
MSGYKIRWGDTLSSLANRFGTTVKAIAQANGIANVNRIFAGRSLSLSGRSANLPGQSDSFSPAPTAKTNMPVINPGSTAGGVTATDLMKLMPNLSAEKASKYLPHLNAAMAEAGINTPKRQAAFLAQLAHESGQLRYMEEIASGAAYEGRRDLGNTQPGDGTRYKGRGPIQLTGRANYRAAGKALGIDLENNPTRAADPDVAFRVATWYWSSRNLNQYADSGDFSTITKRINGGYNGAADRNRYYQSALNILA